MIHYLILVNLHTRNFKGGCIYDFSAYKNKRSYTWRVKETSPNGQKLIHEKTLPVMVGRSEWYKTIR